MTPTSVEARIIADVCAILARPFVEAVESNFAGHFNELRVGVRLRPGATDAEVIEVQNELLAYLDAPDEVRPAGFTWLVTFSQGETKLRSLFPGDALRESPEDLVWRE